MEIKEYKEYNESELLELYASVGWTAYTNDPVSLKKGYENSLLVLGAYEGDKLVGVLRAVGDGYTIVLIQDILVLPQYQRRGIGSALLEAVMARYESVRQLQLVTDDTPKTKTFYQSMGLQEFSQIGCCGFMRI